MTRLLLSLFVLLAGCTAAPPAPVDQPCLPKPPSEGPLTRIPVRFEAGGQPLQLDREAAFASGLRFTPSKARFFASQLSLIDASGQQVPAELYDSGGDRLEYGVTLVDLERPASMALLFKAPPGDYRGLALTLGVPARCESGQQLNHADASAMRAPLDVDSDMYWSWNPGYVFLKFEGQLEGEGFFFHVGGDERLVRLELTGDFTIAPEGGSGPPLAVDLDRLLTTPEGQPRPDVSDAQQRKVHGGAGADALVQNMRQPGFLSLGSDAQ